MIPFPTSPFAPVQPGAPPRPPVTPLDLSHYILTTYPGVEMIEQEEGRLYFAGSDHRKPFVVITEGPVENPAATFCIRLKVSPERCQTLTRAFSSEDAVPGTQLNAFLPDKECAEGDGISICNPAGENLPVLKTCLTEAYGLAARRAASYLEFAA